MKNIVIDAMRNDLFLDEHDKGLVQIAAGWGEPDEWGYAVLTVEQAIQARDWLTAWIESQS